MSKHNVNPNHYKVAGRERQGEDILQVRNKQKLAQSLVRERFEMRQSAPAGTSPVDPSTFPSAPSDSSTQQAIGSSGETTSSPATRPRRIAAAAPARRPTATALSRKGVFTAKKRSTSTTKLRDTNTKTRSKKTAKPPSRATARKSAASDGKKASGGRAKQPSGFRPKSSGGVKNPSGAASRKRTAAR